MDIPSENYKKNKTRLRTVPELDAHQIRTLITLVAQCAAIGEITRKLDIGETDLDIILNRLGIMSSDDARAKLKEYSEDDAVAEQAVIDLRERARKETREAQERLDKREAQDADSDAERAAKAREAGQGHQNEIKDEDADRQRRFTDKKPKTGDLLEQYRRPSTRYVGASVKTRRVESSKFPESMETEPFRQMLLHRGLSFVRDQYDVWT